MSDPRTGALVSAASALIVAACSLFGARQPAVSTTAFAASTTRSPLVTSSRRATTATSPVIPPPTFTPLPTIEPSALDAFLLSIQTDAECRLPCWWEITPGATTWQEARQLFLRIGSIIEPAPGNRPGQETFYIRFPLPTSGVGGARLYAVDGIIQSVFVGSSSTSPRFELNRVLADYGKPDSVLIRTFTSAPEPYPPFNLVLVYQSQQFLAEYEFEARLSGPNVLGCPRRTPPRLHIRASPDAWTNEEVQALVLGQDPSTPLRPVADVTNLDASSFLELFDQAHITACIETPTENW